MIEWDLGEWVEAEYGKRFILKPAWINFTDYVEEKMIANFVLSPYMSPTAWHALYQPELDKWQGIIMRVKEDLHDPTYDGWCVRFPNPDAVTAFEITWS